MSLETVREYFANFNMDHRIMVMETSTATVDEAAKAHEVDPDQIGKTLSFKMDEGALLVVVSGTSRIDNKKYKNHFSQKAKMLNAEEALEHTAHAVGGICPFGLKKPLDVYLDVHNALREPNLILRFGNEGHEYYTHRITTIVKQWVEKYAQLL